MVDENVQPDAQWFGNALDVERRYAAELAAGMREAGASPRVTEPTSRRHRGGIEPPDEDELAELETLANPRKIDATPQPKGEDDEE